MTARDARAGAHRPTRRPVRAAVCAAVLALGSGGAAVAQQAFEDYDPTVLDTCLATAETPAARTDCIGAGARACLATDTGRYNVGIGLCYGAEAAQWDARLNDVFQALIPQQAQVTEEFGARTPNAPDVVAEMRDMQRKWIAFRNAACAWEYMQWTGGTGAGPAQSECLMQLTAQQTLFLEARLQ